jgi:hypothetical protein
MMAIRRLHGATQRVVQRENRVDPALMVPKHFHGVRRRVDCFFSHGDQR